MSKYRLWALTWVLLPASLLGGVSMRLMTDDAQSRLSGELSLTVVLTNQGPDAIKPDLPASVEARVGSATVSMRREGADLPELLPAGSSVLGHYRGALPGSETGMVAIELIGLDAGRCFARIEPPEPSPASTESEDTPSPPRSEPVFRPRFADNLSFYEPMYFVAGPRVSWNAKFQLSFKYRMLSEEGRLVEGRPLWENLFFGYTQTSVWDLGSESAPFLDTSYKPGFFYFDRYAGVRFFGMALESFEGGYRHESNGQDGPDSRSLNTLYIKPTFRIGSREAWFLLIAPRVFTTIGDLSDNPDLADYRGYVELDLRLGRTDSLQLAAILRKGTESNYGSVQFDLTYPLDRLFFGNAASYLHLQYFDGWGETLLLYDEKLPAQVRLGVSLSR